MFQSCKAAPRLLAFLICNLFIESVFHNVNKCCIVFYL